MKRKRFIELVKVFLEEFEIKGDKKILCLDCFLSFPSRHIPSRRSLRYFTSCVVNYLLGINDYCELNYPEAARYINKWKSVWSPPRLDEHAKTVELPGNS